MCILAIKFFGDSSFVFDFREERVYMSTAIGIGFDPTAADGGGRTLERVAGGAKEDKPANWTYGIMLLVAAVIFMNLAHVAQKYMYNGEGLSSPFLLTYMTTLTFCLFIPIAEFRVRMGWTKRARTGFYEGFWNRWRAIQRGISGYIPVNTFDSEEAANDTIVEHHPIGEETDNFTNEYTHWRAFEIGATLAPLWFGANLFFNYSMFETTISRNTIISNLSGTFALVFGGLMGVEKVSYGKVIGVTISLVGILLIITEDDVNSTTVATDDSLGSSSNRLLGDILALCGAVTYGIYSPVLTLLVGDESILGDMHGHNPSPAGEHGSKYSGKPRIPMTLVLGYLGLIVTVGSIPVFLLFGFMCLEDICNITPSIIAMLLLLGIFHGLIAEYLWARSIILTSPTIATVGLGLGIPLAFVSDNILGTTSNNDLVSIVGVLFTTLGFFVVQLDAESWAIFLSSIMRCTGINSGNKNS